MTEVISSFKAEESFVFDHQVKSPLKNCQFRIFKLKLTFKVRTYYPLEPLSYIIW